MKQPGPRTPQRTRLALGWHVVTTWECALKKKSDHPWPVARLPALLEKR